MHQQHHPGDKKAAFTGLIVTAAIVLISIFAMVQWTNGQFEGHGEPAAATN